MSIITATICAGVCILLTVIAIIIRVILGEYESPAETVKGAILIAWTWPFLVIGYPFYVLIKYMAHRLSTRRKRVAKIKLHHVKPLSPEEEIFQIEQREHVLCDELQALDRQKAAATQRLGPYPYRPLLPVKN